MASIKSTGSCSICGERMRKSEIKAHLERCLEKEERKAGRAEGTKMAKLLRILAKGDSEEYWLNLEAPADATLSDLDLFLRVVWLECCGHESFFTIKRVIYTSSTDALFIHEGLNVRLGEVLRPGLEFEYVYGSLSGGLNSTELQLKVLSARVGLADAEFNGSVRILARNDPPSWKCSSCGEPAIMVCGTCSSSENYFLCNGCARSHECGREYQLPVVNSPRLGICKYTGDVEDSAKFRNYLKEVEQLEKNRIDNFLLNQGRKPVFEKTICEGPKKNP